MLKKNIAFQFLLFAIVAILIFIAFYALDTYMYALSSDAGMFFIIFSPLVEMILSFAYIYLFLYFYRKGFFTFLNTKKYYLFMNFFSLCSLLSIMFLYKFFISGSSFIYFLFIVYLLILPLHIAISPLVFVLHARKFANLYFFGLLLPYLLSPFIIIILPLLLIYYPLMLKYTNHLRRKYNINLPIKPDPIIAWFKKSFQKTINKLFKKSRSEATSQTTHPTNQPENQK